VAEANKCVPHMTQVLDAARKANIRVFSMRSIVDIALATTRVGSTLRQFFANRIRSGVITLKEAQNESQIVAIPRRVLSGSDVSDRARCCARSINPNRYGNGGKFLSVPYRFGADRAQSKKCRVGARSFCRWLELVGSDSAVTGC